MGKVGTARLETLLEGLDSSDLDLEGSDITVNSLTSDTGVTVTTGGVSVTAGGAEVTAGNFIVTAGTTYLKGTGGIVRYQGAEATTADSTAVVTAANVLTGIVKCTPSTARSKATDTAANFVSGLGLGADNDSFDFSFLNLSTTGGDNVTLTAGTGVTIVGNAIIAARDDTDNAISVGVGHFRIRRTGATAVTLYRLG
jgi:hypothetical protein